MRRAEAVLAAALLIAAPAAASAQSLHGALDWLPPGSLSVEALSRRPHEALEGGSGRQNFYVELGRLAFRSPDILGGTARKAGLSCQACHANGHVTAAFFIPGLSDAPGRIDVSHAFWNLRTEDHRANPLAIPSLRGVGAKHRLGHDGRVGSLREFTRRVIVLEFAGAEPLPLLLDALVAYQEALRPSELSDVPVTLEQDLRDIRRHLAALALPLAEEDAALAAQMATMIRGQLGFIDERFPGQQAGAVHETLVGWSGRLAGIAAQAETGDWITARASLAALQRAVAEPPAAFAEQAPRSLYDRERLAAWINRPAR